MSVFPPAALQPNSKSSTLPARVRVSRLPLPLTAAVQARLKALFAAQLLADPDQTLLNLAAGAVAVAGGKIIGAALCWPTEHSHTLPVSLQLESGWRGRGIEEALQALLEPEPLNTEPSL